MYKSIPISSLQNGVSQQADEMKRPNQGVEQINFSSSLLKGLSRRANTNHVSSVNLPGSTKQGTFTHLINIGENQKYILLLKSTATSSTVKILDLDGTEKNLYNSAGGLLSSEDLSYFNVANPYKNIKAETVVDYTFVVNKTVTVRKTADSSPVYKPEAICFVKNCRDGASYAVGISHKGSQYSFSTTITDTFTQNATVTSLQSAAQSAGLPNVFSFNAGGDVLYIYTTDGSDFDITGNYSESDSFYVFKNVVQNLTLLPAKCWVGFKTKIQSDPDDPAGSYYVTYKANQENVTSGVYDGFWQETIGDSVEYKLDASTMPRVIVPYSDGFKIQEGDWTDLKVGNNASNPDPSFIDKTINNILFYKNRLGFLSGGARVLSEAGRYFNFFLTRISVLLDSDPVDIEESSRFSATLNSSVEASERLILFSDNSQYTCENAYEPLTPKTAVIVPAGQYNNIAYIDPIALDNSVFFPISRGNNIAVGEYYIDSLNNLFKADDLTEPCKTYINGNLTSFIGSSNARLLALITDAYEGCYIMSYYAQGGQKQMTAWHKFEFGSESELIDIIASDDKLYLLINRDNSLFLEWMYSDCNNVDVDSDRLIYLDRRISDDECTISFSSATGLTTISLPYIPNADNVRIITRESDSNYGGLNKSIQSISGGTLKVRGNLTSITFYVGEVFLSTYTCSRPYDRIANSAMNIYTFVPHGAIKVMSCDVLFNNSVCFSAKIEPKYGIISITDYDSRVMSSYSNIIGEEPPILKDGSLRVLVGRPNTDFLLKIENESAFPCNINGLKWYLNIKD